MIRQAGLSSRQDVATVLRPVVSRYKDLLPAKLASRQLRTLACECQGNVDRLVQLAFDWRYRSAWHPWPLTPISIRPLQIFEELAQLAYLVNDLQPKRSLEIGTANGGTLFLWSWLTPKGSVTVSVDLPEGHFGAGLRIPGNEGYPYWRTRFYERFVNDGRTARLIKGDSHTDETRARVAEHLGGEGLDFVFIDADHTYDGVRTDFEMYADLVRAGGVIAFHDIVERRGNSQCEVSRFWQEVRRRHRYREIVADRNQDWAGIGVLYL
jgi:predicted O-methyltransferase YrrM